MILESTVIDKITQANRNGTLAVFTGAGVSMSSDTDSIHMPSWSEVIEKIRNEIKEIKENDYLKIAQYFYNYADKDEYFSKLENMIPKSLAPSKVHKLIFDINPHIIITTNWDSLLEEANDEFARFYDVIATDSDLSKSLLPHKIIKMHGDFRHSNIVFKEEDYLNYENNFPLISNYIKSILSTHTVLFLGYSYNDYTLKLIVQWLRNTVKYRPEMFLTDFETNSNNSNYLRKHGIETVVLSDINNDLDGIINLKQYSRILYTFLDKIHKGYDPADILNKDEKAIQFILRKLEPLESLNGILIDQIQRSLTNCNFLYEKDSLAILQFNNTLLTGDYNRETRDINLRFLEILNNVVKGENPSEEMLRIFFILAKSGIKGIILEKDEHDKLTYITLDKYLDTKVDFKISEYYDFSYNDYAPDSDNLNVLFETSFKLYNKNKTEEAYIITEKIISLAVQERNYVKLFIAMFNRNVLLKRLQYDLDYKDKYKKIKEYDIESRFNSLTSQLKLAVSPVFDFINYSEIYKYLYSSSEHLDKIKENRNTIERGGIVFSSNIYNYSGEHLNLINFVLANKIMLEKFSLYSKINKNFIEIALSRQIFNDHTILERPEVFSCIKYFDTNELKRLLEDYYKEGSKRFGTFKLSDDDKDWLINKAFKNCVELYFNDENVFRTPFIAYIEKIFLILSIIDLSGADIKSIFSMINKLIAEKSNSILLFQSINLFLGLQYTIYKTKIDKQELYGFYRTLIEKINSNKINGYEIIAFSENYLSYLFAYASIENVIFEDIDIIKNLLNSISEFESDTKISMIQNFVLNIYQISSDEIKDLIKDYVLKCEFMGNITDYKMVLYNNALVILKLKDFTDEDLQNISEYLKPYINNNTFSSILFALDKQIDYMISNMNIAILNDISIKIKDSIKGYQERENKSIF